MASKETTSIHPPLQRIILYSSHSEVLRILPPPNLTRWRTFWEIKGSLTWPRIGRCFFLPQSSKDRLWRAVPGAEDTIENNGINFNDKMRPKRQKTDTAGHNGKTRRSMGTWPFLIYPFHLPPLQWQWMCVTEEGKEDNIWKQHFIWEKMKKIFLCFGEHAE